MKKTSKKVLHEHHTTQTAPCIRLTKWPKRQYHKDFFSFENLEREKDPFCSILAGIPKMTTAVQITLSVGCAYVMCANRDLLFVSVHSRRRPAVLFSMASCAYLWWISATRDPLDASTPLLGSRPSPLKWEPGPDDCGFISIHFFLMVRMVWCWQIDLVHWLSKNGPNKVQSWKKCAFYIDLFDRGDEKKLSAEKMF